MTESIQASLVFGFSQPSSPTPGQPGASLFPTFAITPTGTFFPSLLDWRNAMSEEAEAEALVHSSKGQQQ
jgi:hypothetical protein